ncbi:MAG: xanthine dehydrogenase family protein subunit M [Calditrichaeota bacterium]|nr:xanthine dehydrogenase family protein subunit M [Calditrichota bacterium]
MQVTAIQTYSPKALDEVLQMLAENPGRYTVLSGGTDLVVRMQDGVVRPRHLLNLSFIPELKEIVIEDNQLTFGAGVTFGDILDNRLFQKHAVPLFQAAQIMGSPQIRNLATLGGNIMNASPAGDSIPPLFVLGAEVCLESVNSIRWIKIENFFTGPGKTVRDPQELLTKIRFPIQPDFWQGGFLRLGQREALAISKVSLAFWGHISGGTIRDIRLALGAVAPTVVRAVQTEKLLRGNPLSEPLIQEAVERIKMEAHPISDIRSEADYRKEMCGVLLRRALQGILTTN